MSLTYRSAVEDVLTSFSSVEQSQIAQSAVQHIRETEQREHRFFNFSLKPKQKEKLFNAGIYLSPFSAMPHSHPVCKTLENYMLYSVLPGLISNEFYMVGMKRGKFEFLKSRNPKLDMIGLINRLVTSADRCRYGSEFHITNFEVGAIEGKQRGRFGKQAKATTQSLVPRAIASKARSFFLHDELHYWDKEDLIYFLETLRPKQILGTIVVPPEILNGNTTSLNKWCYEFEVEKGTLAFFPDGVRSEGYYQPMSCIMYLRANKIRLGDGTIYCVDIVHTKFAHHMVSITKGDAVVPKRRDFNNFEATGSAHISRLNGSFESGLPIDHNTISKVYRYLRTLNKPDVQSAMAKLSQLNPEPTGFEIDFMTNFADLVVQTGPGKDLFCSGIKTYLTKMLFRALPDFISKHTKGARQMTLDEFIAKLGPYVVSTGLMCIESDIGTWEDLVPDLALREEATRFLREVEQGDEAGTEVGNPISTPFSTERCGRGYNTTNLNLKEARYELQIERSLTESIEFRVGLSWGISRPHVMDTKQGEPRMVAPRDVLCASIKKMFRGPTFRQAPNLMVVCKLNMAIARVRAERGQDLLRFRDMHPALWFTARKEERECQRFLCQAQTSDSGCCRDERRKTQERAIAELNRELSTLGFLGAAASETPTRTQSAAPQQETGANRSGPREDALDSPSKAQAVGGPPTEQTEDHRMSEGATRVQGEARENPEASQSCSCGTRIAVMQLETTLGLPETLLEGEELPGRIGAWYSMHNEAYSYSKYTHACRGWPAWAEGFRVLAADRGYDVDCVLVQRYKEGYKLNFHADDEEILDEDTAVLCLSTSGECILETKGKGGGGDVCCGGFHISSPSIYIMPSGFQKDHLHSVTSRSGRVSYTFRKMKSRGSGGTQTRSDGFVSDPKQEDEMEKHTEEAVPSDDDVAEFLEVAEEAVTIGEKKKDSYRAVDVPMDGDCFWASMSHFLGIDAATIKRRTMKVALEENGLTNSELFRQSGPKVYAERESVMACAHTFSVKIVILGDLLPGHFIHLTPKNPETSVLLRLEAQHYSPLYPAADCLPRAIAEALSRDVRDVYKKILSTPSTEAPFEDFNSEGISAGVIEEMMELFDIEAHVEWDGADMVLNPGGHLERYFSVEEGHISLIYPEKKLALNPEETKLSVFKVLKGNGSKVGDGSADFSVAARRSGGNRRSERRPNLKVLERSCTKIQYRYQSARALNLIKNLETGDTGILCDLVMNKGTGVRELIEGKGEQNLEVEVGVVVGTFGAGKSTLFRNFIKKNAHASVVFVSPRKGLALETQELLEQAFEEKGDQSLSGFLTNGQHHDAVAAQSGSQKEQKRKTSTNRELNKKRAHKVYTFEVLIRKLGTLRSNDVIVVDEAQLYPPGYIDLIIGYVKCSGLRDVQLFLVGDPCQSEYDSERDRFSYFGFKPDLEWALEGQSYKYAATSNRFRNRIFEGRLPCDLNEERIIEREEYTVISSVGELRELPKARRGVVLVPSFAEKRILDGVDVGEVQVLTYGESTGRNYEYGIFCITNNTKFCSDKRTVTALSRFSRNITLLNLTGETIENVALDHSERPLGRFLCGRASRSDLLEMLPGNPRFVSNLESRIGKDQGKREEKMYGDPWLKTMIELMQSPDMEAAEEAVCEVQAENQKTHVPRSELESIRAGWVHEIREKWSREQMIKGLVTDQFTEAHSKNRGRLLTNAAERYEAIYPRHRHSDTATFLMAVKKRLRFSKPHVEMAKYAEAKNYAPFLLKEFLKRVPLERTRNDQMYQDAMEDFCEKKTSKSGATIENHAGRSSRDWLADVAFIFSKSQLCTKYEKRFVNAKAAQSIVCFQHSVLCRFAPFMRYIEKKLMGCLPKKYYIHSGHGLEVLNEWVIGNRFDGECTESDYEAFDASQDEYMLAFEVAIMEYLNIPRDLVSDYVYIKTHLGSKLGNFAIMRFSGEASTFLFNTMANMLFTFLRYDIKRDTSICFAGDDMCASRRLRVHDKHQDFLKKLSLKAKVCFTKTPTFCGWNLTEDGIFKKPQLVLERLCIARETNNLANCIDNYAIEVSYAYKLGERALCKMSQEEAANHYQCVRLIVQSKNLIKSDVAKVFENACS